MTAIEAGFDALLAAALLRGICAFDTAWERGGLDDAAMLAGFCWEAASSTGAPDLRDACFYD